MISIVIMEGISKATAVLLVLMKVYTISCHDRDYFNVILVLQSCTHSLHILPGSCSDTYATSSDCTYHVGNMNVEEDFDMQVERREVNVKTEKSIDSEEEECIAIKDEDIYSEEEEEVEDIDIKEEEDAGIKEEVSLESTM